MKTVVDFGILTLTVALMFSVGLELEARHFKELVRNKGTFLGALIGQMVVLPVIGILIVRAIPLPEYLRVGILLVAACPVGDIANFYTMMAREMWPCRWLSTRFLVSCQWPRCRWFSECMPG